MVALTLALGMLNLCLGFAAAMYLGYGPPGLAEAWRAFWPRTRSPSAAHSAAQASLAAAVQAAITADPESDAGQLEADLHDEGFHTPYTDVESPEEDSSAPPESLGETEPLNETAPLGETELLGEAEPSVADAPSEDMALSELCRTTVDSPASDEPEPSGDSVETLLVAEIDEVRSAWNDLHQGLMADAARSDAELSAVTSDEQAQA